VTAVTPSRDVLVELAATTLARIAGWEDHDYDSDDPVTWDLAFRNPATRVVDALIAAGAVVPLDTLADLIAQHDAYHVNEDGWTVCICGHVVEGDDDDGSHARHVAAALSERGDR
jgi:hypothetical protein